MAVVFMEKKSNCISWKDFGVSNKMFTLTVAHPDPSCGETLSVAGAAELVTVERK